MCTQLQAIAQVWWSLSPLLHLGKWPHLQTPDNGVQVERIFFQGCGGQNTRRLHSCASHEFPVFSVISLGNSVEAYGELASR